MFKWLRTFRREAGYAHVSIDERDRILSWDKGAVELFGWESGEVLGRPLSEIMIPLAYRLAHRAGLERLRQGLPDGRLLNKELHTTALHKSGHLLTIRMLVSRMTPRNAAPYYMASLATAETEFVVLGPEGPIASPVASEKEQLRLRNEALLQLLADATVDLSERDPQPQPK